jgi:hypothetical protein
MESERKELEQMKKSPMESRQNLECGVRIVDPNSW